MPDAQCKLVGRRPEERESPRQKKILPLRLAPRRAFVARDAAVGILFCAVHVLLHIHILYTHKGNQIRWLQRKAPGPISCKWQTICIFDDKHARSLKGGGEQEEEGRGRKKPGPGEHNKRKKGAKFLSRAKNDGANLLVCEYVRFHCKRA